MFRFLICDDDAIFCKKEEEFIKEYFSKQQIETDIQCFYGAEDIINLEDKISSYDAIFLDVSMENINGINLASWLNSAAPNIIIVFVSGYMSYALDGYKVGAVRYIMKDEHQFEKSMEECLEYIIRESNDDDKKYVAITEDKIRISVEKILYVESTAHRITYHLMKSTGKKTEYSMYGKLDDAEKQLTQFGFCRVHQSYLINMNLVKDVYRYEAVFLNGLTIQIAKRKYKYAEDQFVRIRGTF